MKKKGIFLFGRAMVPKSNGRREARHTDRDKLFQRARRISQVEFFFCRVNRIEHFVLEKAKAACNEKMSGAFTFLRPVVIKSCRFIRIVSYGPLTQSKQKFCIDRRGRPLGN